MLSDVSEVEDLKLIIYLHLAPDPHALARSGCCITLMEYVIVLPPFVTLLSSFGAGPCLWELVAAAMMSCFRWIAKIERRDVND